MARTIVAKKGDTLCGIAIREGFFNCDPLLAEDANEAYRTRALRSGDRVTIPDRRPRDEEKEAEKTHRFRLKRTPEPSIRFVHGSKDEDAGDATLDHVDVSNYPTNKAGRHEDKPFTADFGFDADADADPDTFKVELVTPDGGASITVQLEALKPVYGDDGKVVRHEPFDGAARRKQIELRPVKGDAKRFRSRYLRLVTDEVDEVAVPEQTLLTSTIADGRGGEADRVEILDQRVRASYTLPGCKAKLPCTVIAEVEVGHDRMRIRMALHVFRATPGGPWVDGLTEQMVRQRVLKWVRRVYAQANLSPKLDPMIEVLDPPWPNMISIGQTDGARTAGAAGEPALLSFTLGSRAVDPVHAPRVVVPLAPGMTPVEVGAAIVAALPEGYVGTAYENPRKKFRRDAHGFLEHPKGGIGEPSCDVLITRTDGATTVIRSEATSDLALKAPGNFVVARVDLARVDDSDDLNEGHTPDMRRILRSGTTSDDRIDVFVIDRFAGTAHGWSLTDGRSLPADMRLAPPLRRCIIVACNSEQGKLMDASDNKPFTLAHEVGHVLSDRGHTDPPTELMHNGGSKAHDSVGDAKRICDDPVRFGYFDADPAHPDTIGEFFEVAAVQDFRARGAALLEPW
jgi:hypothetical protein